MPLLIRTAALLGTPSKTLLSGTPEFVRGSRQFCVTVGERKGLHTLFPRWASIDKRTRVPDEKQEALIWTREQGYDADGNDFDAEVHMLDRRWLPEKGDSETSAGAYRIWQNVLRQGRHLLPELKALFKGPSQLRPRSLSLFQHSYVVLYRVSLSNTSIKSAATCLESNAYHFEDVEVILEDPMILL